MSKIKLPLLSLSASGSISGALTFLKRIKRQIVEKKPELKDAQTAAQLDWRHMFLKVVALWHALSAAEQAEWESAARPRHMTGYAWFISQALRPNPGIYLPLQGGTMQGIIDMDGYAIQDMKDPVAVQDADTKAARDAAIAAAIGGSLTCDIYGYDGAAWQKLLVESAAQHNLRVRLYDGASKITAGLWSDSVRTLNTVYGQDTSAMIYLYGAGGLSYVLVNVNLLVDNSTGTNMPPSGLYGFNGTRWDRLRTWGLGTLKVGRDAIDSTTLRKTAAGAVVAGVRKLFWIACSPDAPGAEFELTDAIAGGAAVVFDHFDPDKHSEIINFDPPMKFANGIFIEKFDHIHSLTFCYT